MNRFQELFKKKQGKIISIYFPAGYPELNSTGTILTALQLAGADMVEIGIPFSDPLADGEVIQQASKIALENGINLDKIFEQITETTQPPRPPKGGDGQHTSLQQGKAEDIPPFGGQGGCVIVLMGYYNTVLQYGIKNFCEKCQESGVDGVILPDLPLNEFQKECATHFKKNNLSFISLITPQTPDEKIRRIDDNSDAFIYAVSASSTTGAKDKFALSHEEYFKKIQNMKLKNPVLVGFGVSNRETFDTVCKYLNGVVIGSAFIKSLPDPSEGGDKETASRITSFISKFTS